MKQKFQSLLIAMILLMPGVSTQAQGANLSFTSTPNIIRPGKSERISVATDVPGPASLIVFDKEDNPIHEIYLDIQLDAGENHLVWDGMNTQVEAISPGPYELVLSQGNRTASQALTIGDISPRISQLLLDDTILIPGQPWGLAINVNMPGELAVVFHVADQTLELFHDQVGQGEVRVDWDGMNKGNPVPSGPHTLSVVFVDQHGFPANQQHVTVQVNELPAAVSTAPQDVDAIKGQQMEQPPLVIAGAAATSAPKTHNRQEHYKPPTQDEVSEDQLGSSYWHLPVGKWDEEAIWKVMQQPITVLTGKDQRETYKLRATKDDSLKRENIVGEITYVSQGVNILSQSDDGWSYVEVFNSSYGPSNRTRRGYGDTDDLIRGYVRTSELHVVTPREDYGILIDKLKQRLYVFKEGKLYTELLISTGKPTKQQPWNETPSGEFLMVSRVGEFNAGNLVCRMALRINGGALIHEVPYIVNQNTGYWDYSSQEAQLGVKASHGCVRVQRLNNDDGINMTWLWNNIRNNVKVLVWDDAPGRFHPYPEDSLKLFYNPVGGKYYHLDQNCRSIKARFLPLPGEMTYAELESASFDKLTPCKVCTPPIRASEIDQINKDNGF